MDMAIRVLPLIGFIIVAAGATEPPAKKWYKGNLHTHSYWSDGDEFPEMIMDWYKTKGYDFVALSDHNRLAQGERWINVRKGRIYNEAFEKYRQKFGDEWVTYKRDTSGIEVLLKTYEEYKPLFEDEGFLIIQSEEISDNSVGKPIHINVTNIRELIPPQGGSTVTEVMQRNVDAVLSQREKTGVPMFAHVNHPNFHFAIKAEDFYELKGERFFEVFNGHPEVYNYGDGTHQGTEAMWDEINLVYARKNQPFLYGLATDDSHNYHLFGADYSNAGRGWVMVNADTLTAESLVNAMERGNFYASTGVSLDDVAVYGRYLQVFVHPEENVNYTIEFIGAKKKDQRTRVLRKRPGTRAAFKLKKKHVFVRARITSDKLHVNPFREGDFERAWTQPVKLGQ